jgi:hypothetical protein
MNVYFQYSLHFLWHLIIFALFYSVQYWTGKDEYISDFQCSLNFYKIFFLCLETEVFWGLSYFCSHFIACHMFLNIKDGRKISRIVKVILMYIYNNMDD